MPEIIYIPAAQWKKDIRLAQQGNTGAFLRLQQSFASLLRYEAKKIQGRHTALPGQERVREYTTLFQAVILNFFHFIDEFHSFEQPGHEIPQKLHRYLLCESRCGNYDSISNAPAKTANTKNILYNTTGKHSCQYGKPTHGPDHRAYAAEIEKFKILTPQFPQHVPYSARSRFHRRNLSRERYLSLRPFPWKNRLYIRFCVKEADETELDKENLYKVRIIILLL